ncbi:uncharacterized protein F5147DRAFT_612902 [Suillus discolor]|uniref:NACHT domain-containing protein n=1 Tax=Suillus discolor TaxID=1912936 RepID=A0A9P7JTS5_9AGAM|nr:uncharacterized protein F5147DRAFT_612902 [Suillus discolor]KAG2107927.1 hypothetical protein F5147DRAFT_612902 [Suillus discolor]
MSNDQFLEEIWLKLSQVAVTGAQYNSGERLPHPKCLNGTRVDLLKYIHELLDDPEKNQLIWLHGTAGVGKSAVAFTVAETMRGLKVTEETPGTFFFSRKYTKRCTAGHFFATLAYQLATNFPSIRMDVSRAIRNNPALLNPDTPLRDQMEALFLQPLRRLRLRFPGCPPLTFVVDALDECTSKPEITDLILSLAQALREPDLPVTHILLTSRSESHIHKAFQNEEVRPLVREISVRTSGDGISLDGVDVDNDICTFLQHSFEELESRHPDFPKLSMDDLAKLASRAGRRFIVASTMMKFIIDDEDKDPRDRLQLMLKLTSKLLPGTEVYKFYDCILSTCADPKRAYMHLSIVAALTDPLPISQISSLLGPGLGRDVQTTLIQLRSFVDIPGDSILPVNIHHSSIRDYVFNSSNSSIPQVREHDMPSPHSLLADSSFRLMMKEIPESTALLDALSGLMEQSHAMQHMDHSTLKNQLAFLVRPPEPVSVLICMLWLRGDRRSDMQFWLKTMDGSAWLQTWNGQCWLKTREGREWLLRTQGGREWLQTEAGIAWQVSVSVSDSDSDSSMPPLQPPVSDSESDGRTLDSRISKDRDVFDSSDPSDWYTSQEEDDQVQLWRRPDWLQTQEGQSWLQTKEGWDWLRTAGGRDWLTRRTRGGRRWLKTKGGRRWLQTQAGRGGWLQTEGGRDWLKSQTGRDWLARRSRGGRIWLKTKGGRRWLQTQEGRDWLQTEGGRDWLKSRKGRDWLKSLAGRDWLQSRAGQDWLQTRAGWDWLQTHAGWDWLQTQAGRNWLQTKVGRDWLQTKAGRDWLKSPDGPDWLKSPDGQDWLQTSHVQAWKSTPAASVWVTLDEFSSMLEAITQFIIVQELRLLPTFQVVQQFKSLPDFLMFPVFLALSHQHHSTVSSTYRSPNRKIVHPPDRKIVRAMNAFMTFAHNAQRTSQLSSDTLKYACQNWATHLSRAPDPRDETLNYIFQAFWDRYLLSWLEWQWCSKGLRSCLVILSEGQKLVKCIPGP